MSEDEAPLAPVDDIFGNGEAFTIPMAPMPEAEAEPEPEGENAGDAMDVDQTGSGVGAEDEPGNLVADPERYDIYVPSEHEIYPVARPALSSMKQHLQIKHLIYAQRHSDQTWHFFIELQDGTYFFPKHESISTCVNSKKLSEEERRNAKKASELDPPNIIEIECRNGDTVQVPYLTEEFLEFKKIQSNLRSQQNKEAKEKKKQEDKAAKKGKKDKDKKEKSSSSGSGSDDDDDNNSSNSDDDSDSSSDSDESSSSSSSSSSAEKKKKKKGKDKDKAKAKKKSKEKEKEKEKEKDKKKEKLKDQVKKAPSPPPPKVATPSIIKKTAAATPAKPSPSPAPKAATPKAATAAPKKPSSSVAPTPAKKRPAEDAVPSAASQPVPKKARVEPATPVVEAAAAAPEHRNAPTTYTPFTASFAINRELKTAFAEYIQEGSDNAPLLTLHDWVVLLAADFNVRNSKDTVSDPFPPAVIRLFSSGKHIDPSFYHPIPCEVALHNLQTQPELWMLARHVSHLLSQHSPLAEMYLQPETLATLENEGDRVHQLIKPEERAELVNILKMNIQKARQTTGGKGPVNSGVKNSNGKH